MGFEPTVPVTRTTVFEFYDSHADPCRTAAKRVLWFANLASTILPCIARYRSVPRSWFAIFSPRGLSVLIIAVSACATEAQRQINVKYGAATPKRSMAEMQALATPPCSVALPSGKLGVHEEFPDEVAEAVTSFLDRRKAGRWEARCTDTAEGQRSDTKR